ncbi:MAG: undecaprenyl-diphosphatase UppP [Candidatus Pacebacteria bacterium]|nr:undecaprenyl-diphosphatase UppP [Candidatus Paceibacterota bacterium]
MFNFFHAIVLGLIEGVTEFLPISSTGHLILTTKALGIQSTDFVKSFEIIIQLGAILAVVVLYFKKIFLNFKIFKRVAVAFIPTVIVGLIFYRYIKQYLLGNSNVVLWSLAIGGVALIAFEIWKKGKGDTVSEIESITYKQAFIIGLWQTLAIVPGVSRSASTIVGGLFLGISRVTIVEFSFLLAIPTMIGATGLDLLKSGFSFSSSETVLLGIGLLTAFVSAIISIKLLLKFVQTSTFIPFGVYRILLAIVFFIFLI